MHLRPSSVLCLSLLLCSCAQTQGAIQDSAPNTDSDACVAGRDRFLAELQAGASECTADADCTELPPRQTGRCGVFANAKVPAASVADVAAACDHVPQEVPHCEPLMAACVSGRCLGAKVDTKRCEDRTAEYASALGGASVSCETDSECRSVALAGKTTPVSAAGLASLTRVESGLVALCGEQSRPKLGEARCTEHRCAFEPERDGPLTRLTRPSVDQDCLTHAMHPLIGQFRGVVVLKTTIFADGHLNYFRVVDGPAKLTRAVLPKLAGCRAKPATVEGQPVAMDYVLNLRFR